MPFIPNYIARLRTHSQSTGASSSHSGSNTNSTAGPSTPASELARLAADTPVQQPENSLIARKIHPDLSALLDEDEGVVEDLGPRPPRGRSRSAEQLTRQEPEPAAAPSPSHRTPLLSRILSVPLLSGTPDADDGPDSSGTPTHWSTFGRRRALPSAIGEFGSLSKRSSRRKPSTTTPSTTRPPSSSARTAPGSQPNSPAGTVSSSSKSHSQSGHSHSVRSRRAPLAHPEPIPDAEPLDPQTPVRAPFHASPSPDVASPPVGRPTLDSSPQTFGRATPKQGSDSKPYPALGGVFVPPSILTPQQPHRKSAARDPPATYPPRKRTRSRPTTGSIVSFPTLPRKRSTSRLGVEDVFQTGDHRRLSANWSAVEAVRGGNGRQGETWPATVSREMVRLALSSGRGEEDVAVGEVGTLSDGPTKNATLFGSVGEDRRRFMWAGRRRTNTSGAPVSQSSSVPWASTLQPAVSVSPPSGSGSVPKTTEGSRAGNDGLAPQLSVTAPTPSPSPSGSRFGTMSDPTPRRNSDHNLRPQSPGKRKIGDAEDEEPAGMPKKNLLSGSRGSSNRASDASGSHAPSSFRQTKRIRLSTPSHSPEHLSRSISQSPHLSPPGSPSSRPPSRPPSSLRTLPNPRSVSQSSIPLRAIISPRPPSIDRRSAYHMRDPALPPSRRQSTQWAGSARKLPDEGLRAFPLQGWAFMLGFVLFPMWWVAAVAPVGWRWRRRTSKVQDGKGVWVEDLEALEVWEYDVAYQWRRRCRLMSILGLLVYIPIIVLLAIFVPRT